MSQGICICSKHFGDPQPRETVITGMCSKRKLSSDPGHSLTGCVTTDVRHGGASSSLPSSPTSRLHNALCPVPVTLGCGQCGSGLWSKTLGLSPGSASYQLVSLGARVSSPPCASISCSVKWVGGRTYLLGYLRLKQAVRRQKVLCQWLLSWGRL